MRFIQEALAKQKIKKGAIQIYDVKVRLNEGTEELLGNTRQLSPSELATYKSIERSMHNGPEFPVIHIGWHLTSVYAVFDKGSDTSIRFAWGGHMNGVCNWGQHHIVRLDSGFHFFGDLGRRRFHNRSEVAAFIVARPELWKPYQKFA